MEKAIFLSNMKQMHDFKFKVRSFDFGGDSNSPNPVDRGFSWPPRSYVCSFCKREFRSAQALGGHMNVHRRDRARLRQSPTRDGESGGGGQFCPLDLNLEPNPSLHSNPNSSPSLLPSSPPPNPHFTSKLAPHAALVERCRPITADLMKVRAAKGILSVDRFDSPAPGFVRLDLEIGLISPSKEELDLELRLGF